MKTVKAYAPINIALVKYWGKRDEALVLPYNPSISLSLDIFGTTTTLMEQATPGFKFLLNGCEDAKTAVKVRRFLEPFGFDETIMGLTIESVNSGPTAAGLASSASAFAALAVACNHYFGNPFDFDALSALTRKGSGSAIRSLLGGCVIWHDDGHVSKLSWPFEDVGLAVVALASGKKAIGSTEGMKHTVLTAESYPSWVAQSHQDAGQFMSYLEAQDFSKLGQLAEDNALRMHKVCADAKPPILYLNERSNALIEGIQHARKQGLFEAYCTMDAGPNVKLLHRKNDADALKRWLEAHGYPTPLFSGIDTKGATIYE